LGKVLTSLRKKGVISKKGPIGQEPFFALPTFFNKGGVKKDGWKRFRFI